MKTITFPLVLLFSSTLFAQQSITIYNDERMMGCHCRLILEEFQSDTNQENEILISFRAIDNQYQLGNYMDVFEGTPQQTIEFLNQAKQFYIKNQIKGKSSYSKIMGHFCSLEYFEKLKKHYLTIFDKDTHYSHQFNLKLIEEVRNALLKWGMENKYYIDSESMGLSQEKLDLAHKNDLIKKYGETDAIKILEGKIWLGMTDKMTIDCWGKPGDIHRSVGSWGVNEQWVYGDTYLYFENGVLTSWQD